ncbi:MAG: hypothetical protein EOR16_15760 [Mesorhizobium sp.]|nr:MAG: hypothetical protein EOR16_15760 [Mesorhizobium sp.]
MALRGTFLVPTMVVTAKPMPLPISAVDIRSLQFGNKLVRRAYELGVKVGAGTDAGAPELCHGWALHAEIALMVNDQGIPAVEAIKAATLVNAELAEISDKAGSVEPGKRADLVVLSANPVDDILNTMKIEQVMLAGRFIDREPK